MKYHNTQPTHSLTNPRKKSTTQKLSNSLSSVLGKSVLTAALFALGVSLSQAQTAEKRHFIALKAGTSSPMGSYGSTDSKTGSYAQLGSNLNVEAAMFLTPYLGVGISAGSFANSVDAEAMLDDATIGESYISSSLETGSYSNGYYMGGVFFAIPLKKATIDFRALAGSLTTTSPKLELNVNDGAYNNRVLVNGAEGTAFGYNLGFGARINFTPKWALKVTGDYISGKTELTRSYQETYEGQNSNGFIKSTPTISAYLLGIGIAYQIVK